MQILKKAVDNIPVPGTAAAVKPEKGEPAKPQFTAMAAGKEITVTGKVVEDCDKPWAMTSDSLYGLFAADWTKEAENVPEIHCAIRI